MSSPNEWVELMIDDFRQIAGDIASTVVVWVDWNAANLTSSYEQVVGLQGDPAAIPAGARIINDDVKGMLEDALADLEAGTDGVNFRDSWQGSGANAFKDYLPRLKAGYTVLIDNCKDVAESLSAYASGLELLYAEILTALIDLAGTIAGLDYDLKGDDEAKKKSAVSKVMGGIDTFLSIVSAVATLWTKAMKTNTEVANLIDKLVDYKKLDKLTTVAGGDPRFYSGPTGEQLPMPTDVSLDPDWSKDEIKQRWDLKSDGEVAIRFEPFMAMVAALRANGEYFSNADGKLVEAWVGHLPQAAFSTILSNANGYYATLTEVLTARHLTLLHSPGRLHELGDALDLVAGSYGQQDDEDATVLRDYLRN